MFVSYAAATLALLSFALNLWQWVVARRYPLHQRVTNPSFAPAVTVLKPLKGCDAHTEACLRSWFEQEYSGPVQILFGVATEADPAYAVATRLIAVYPKVDAAVILADQALGLNAKVSKLVQLHALSAHEFIIISDADVWAPPDLIRNLVHPFTEQGVGLVNCFYEMTHASTLPMELEAISANADFWSQVLQARSIKPMDFALGAAMATTQAQLKAIGGFAPFLDYLADDYQLGQKIAASGGRIELCPLVVECRSHAMGWKEVWLHQLRWTRTIRVCQPLPFFFSILSNGTLWPLLWLLSDPSTMTAAGALVLWSARIGTARSNQRRLTRRSPALGALFLPLMKDLLGVALWMLAFSGNRVEWRGRRFVMQRDGRLAA